MWIADGWKDYEVLDTSSGEKLERWGDYMLVRPDPQVLWTKLSMYDDSAGICLLFFGEWRILLSATYGKADFRQ